MIVKVHNTQDGQSIVAICDTDLLGKKIEEGNLQLDLSSDFYKGIERNEEDVIRILKSVYIANLVGKESIALAKKLGFLEEEHVKFIGGIPHAQIVLVSN